MKGCPETVSLWLCKECGFRWWTRTSEPFKRHSCLKHEHPMLARIDVDIDTQAEMARQ